MCAGYVLMIFNFLFYKKIQKSWVLYANSNQNRGEVKLFRVFFYIFRENCKLKMLKKTIDKICRIDIITFASLGGAREVKLPLENRIATKN